MGARVFRVVAASIESRSGGSAHRADRWGADLLESQFLAWRSLIAGPCRVGVASSSVSLPVAFYWKWGKGAVVVLVCVVYCVGVGCDGFSKCSFLKCSNCLVVLQLCCGDVVSIPINV